MVFIVAMATIPLVGAQPDPVQNLAIIGDQELAHVIWDEHPNASEDSYYLVYKHGLGEGFNLSIPLANVTDTQYIDVDVENFTYYFYGVIFVDAQGLSSELSQIWVYVLPINEQPLPPTNLTASLNFYYQPFLEWEPSPSVDVGGYRIYRREAGEEYNLSVYKQVSKTTKSFADYTFEGNTTYFYSLATEDDSDSVQGNLVSELSNEVSIYAPAIPLNIVSDVTLSSSLLAPGELKVTWSPSRHYDYFFYGLYIATDPIESVDGLQRDFELDFYLVEDIEFTINQQNYPLELGEEYYVAVTVIDWGMVETEATADTTAGPVLFQLAFEVDAAYLPEDDGSFLVNWIANTVPDFGHYDVFISNTSEMDTTNMTDAVVIQNQATNNAEITMADFPFIPQTEYYVGVVAVVDNTNYTTVNVAGPVLWNASEPLPPPPVLPQPDPVANLTLIADQELAHLVWDEHSNASEDSYYLVYKHILGEEYNLSEPLANITYTQYIDEDVENDTVYWYGVKLVNAEGFSSNMSELQVYVLPFNEVPLPPTDVSISLDYYYQPVLEWVASESDDVFQYRIYRREPGNAYNLEDYRVISSSKISFTDDIFEPNSTYIYSMASRDFVNSVEGSKVSDLSNEVSIFAPTPNEFASERRKQSIGSD